jgi:hypothetical protein
MQIGIFGLLGVIFVCAKLFGYIAWSWWLVLLPIYGGVVLFLLIALLVVVLAALAESRRGRW